MKPFTCPQCGSHAYRVVLTGCSVSNATLEESYEWDAKDQEYASSGTLLVESDDVTPGDSQAICSGCERDVTAAVAEYETSLEEAAGA
jgi:ribosomal protein L37E